jgi:DNA-binding MarR family transcriptional regulator
MLPSFDAPDELPPFASLPAFPERLTRWPGFVLGKIADSGSAYFNAALAPLAINRHDLDLLILLEELQPVRQVALARLLVLSPATITHVVNELEDLGAVERRRDPSDKRAHHLHLTERGAAMIREAEAISQKVTESLFGILSTAERKAFHGMLLRVARLEP